MPIIERHDEPGAQHHVMSRGVARRTIFENDADYRWFLVLCARATRRGVLTVEAYSLLPNHFHLLVLSPKATLSRGMHWILSSYGRYYNDRYMRDGPLFRSRFKSRPIEGPADWGTVARYIDMNPTEAGLAVAPWGHVFGSAHGWERARPHPWLYTDRIRRILQAATGLEAIRPGDYSDVFYNAEAKLQGHHAQSIGLSAQQHYQRRERAQLADGTQTAFPFVSADVLDNLVASSSAKTSEWQVQSGVHHVPAWTLIRIALLRSFSCYRPGEIAIRLGVSPQTVRRALASHASLIDRDINYRETYDRIANSLSSVGGKKPLGLREAIYSPATQRPQPGSKVPL